MFNEQLINDLINKLQQTVATAPSEQKLDHIYHDVFAQFPFKTGSGRYVVIIDELFVIKLALNLNGTYQNTTEVETKNSPKLSPILKSIPLFGFDNFIIIQEYNIPLDDYYNQLIDGIYQDIDYEYDSTPVIDLFSEKNLEKLSDSTVNTHLIEFTKEFIKNVLDDQATLDDFWSMIALKPLRNSILDELGHTPDNNIENIAVSIEGEYILNDYGIQSQRQLNEILNNKNSLMQTFTVGKLKERRP